MDNAPLLTVLVFRGNSASQPEGSTKGYHVLKVIEDGPADRAGIEPYFDFIASINGIRLDSEANLSEQLAANVGREVLMHVYSTKRQSVRVISVIPSDNWARPEDGFLGCSVRFCDFQKASENVWHILDVQPNSPAAQAGLRSEYDYVIGSPNASLFDKDDLYNLVVKHIGQTLPLFVYNSEYDAIREVLIFPNNSWGVWVVRLATVIYIVSAKSLAHSQ
ncbi:Golgi reassembly-stacking protein 2 [Rhizophlyctis rosea]|nr:Golgi reassembly-stacking protein 2 [Rhizophlyctis rosea]